jgi:hypothetical protein
MHTVRSRAKQSIIIVDRSFPMSLLKPQANNSNKINFSPAYIQLTEYHHNSHENGLDILLMKDMHLKQPQVPLIG